MNRLLFFLSLCLCMQQASAGWFQRDDQIAAQALENGQPERAAKLFKDDYRRGVAQYRAGQYRDAEHSFAAAQQDPARTAIHDDALFNQANSAFQLGNYAGAIRAYETLLKRDANHADARHNLEVTLRKLGKFLPETPDETTQDKPEDQDQKKPKPDETKSTEESTSKDSEESEAGQSRSESDAAQSEQSQTNDGSDPDKSDKNPAGKSDDPQESDSSSSSSQSSSDATGGGKGTSGKPSEDAVEQKQPGNADEPDDSGNTGEKPDDAEGQKKDAAESSSGQDGDSENAAQPDKQGGETGKQGDDSERAPEDKGGQPGEQKVQIPDKVGSSGEARDNDARPGKQQGTGMDRGDTPRDQASDEAKGNAGAPQRQGQPDTAGQNASNSGGGPDPSPPDSVDTFINQAVHLFDQLGLAGSPEPDSVEAAAPGDQAGGTEGLSDTLAEQMLDRVEGDPGTLLRRQFGFQEQRVLAQRGQGLVEPRPW
ncbi:MAG: tetratricopeptide repeat protein [Gammaproteobacteria bacterium]|nr:tetratricopeptide repeat protein [Gammaproteobacteria bacterium]MCP5136168.1 tetratricopeptide repeat protein [Gammaproteobacteria bacterium]